MTETPEIIDRERPGVSEQKARLDRLAETAREYERVKKAKARNTWEKREQAYGTQEEIQSASRVLEASLEQSRSQTTDQDIQRAFDDRLIAEDDAARLREHLGSVKSRDRDGHQRD
jgi:hypothetical protein